MPPVGSKIVPQLPAKFISAFNVATLAAVAEFCNKPSQAFAAFGQFTFNGVVFILIAVAPTLKRTISLKPSSLTGKFGEQASTSTLSIEKH